MFVSLHSISRDTESVINQNINQKYIIMYSQVLNDVNNGMFVELNDIISVEDLVFKGLNIEGFNIVLKNGNKLFINNNDGDEFFCDVRNELIKEKFEKNYSENRYSDAMPIPYDLAESFNENGSTQFHYDKELQSVKLLKWGKFIFHKENEKAILDILLD